MKIPMEDWLRGCVYHDGRHGEVTLSTDKVLDIADYIQLTRTSLADGMIELPPYESKDEPFDKDINVRSKDEDKTNNFAENLEWCTNEYNLSYGKAKERKRKKIKGRPLTEEHRRKISESLKRHYGERKETDHE